MDDEEQTPLETELLAKVGVLRKEKSEAEAALKKWQDELLAERNRHAGTRAELDEANEVDWITTAMTHDVIEDLEAKLAEANEKMTAAYGRASYWEIMTSQARQERDALQAQLVATGKHEVSMKEIVDADLQVCPYCGKQGVNICLHKALTHITSLEAELNDNRTNHELIMNNKTQAGIIAEQDKKLAALTKFLGQDGTDIIEKNERIAELELMNEQKQSGIFKIIYKMTKLEQEKREWLGHKERIMSERDVAYDKISKLETNIKILETHLKLVRNCELYPSHCGHCGVSDCKLYHIKDKVCPNCGRTIVVDGDKVRCYYCSTGWTPQAAIAAGLYIIPIGTQIKDIKRGTRAVVTGYDKNSGPEWIAYQYDGEKIDYIGHISNFKIISFPR